MSFIALLTSTLIVGAEPTGEALEQLLVRWDGECQGAAAATAPCVGLGAEIELGLYDLIRKLSLSRQPIDREVLRKAAQAHLPALAKLGVSLLGEPKELADHVALLAAADHPVLAVRYIAARNLEAGKNPTWTAMQRWSSGWNMSAANAPEESLVPDLRPLPSQFGMKSFNGLTFHYFGSDRERAMFTTSEPAQAVVERFGKSRQVLSSMDAMQQQMDAIQPEMDAITKEMEAAGEAQDMDRLQKAMQRMEALQAKMGNVSTVAANPMATSHTVILETEAKTKRATANVVIQRDDALNRTVLVFWREGGWRM